MRTMNHRITALSGPSRSFFYFAAFSGTPLLNI